MPLAVALKSLVHVERIRGPPTDQQAKDNLPAKCRKTLHGESGQEIKLCIYIGGTHAQAHTHHNKGLKTVK